MKTKTFQRNFSMKAQSAVMDGLFFMLICGAASALLFQAASLSAQSTSRQISAIYNYEFASNSLVSMHYAKDAGDRWFWNVLKEKISVSEYETAVQSYIRTAPLVSVNDDDGYASGVWTALLEASPSRNPVLFFNRGEYSFYCYGEKTDEFTCSDILPDSISNKQTVYSSSVNLIDDYDEKWTVIMQLYY